MKQSLQSRFSEDHINFLRTFKVNQCSNMLHFSQQQNYANSCFYYHNQQDRRRCPLSEDFNILYSHIFCNQIIEQSHSLEVPLDECTHAHNQIEINYHPTCYKLHQCQNQDHLNKFFQKNGEDGDLELMSCYFSHENHQNQQVAHMGFERMQERNLSQFQMVGPSQNHGQLHQPSNPIRQVDFQLSTRQPQWDTQQQLPPYQTSFHSMFGNSPTLPSNKDTYYQEQQRSSQGSTAQMQAFNINSQPFQRPSMNQGSPPRKYTFDSSGQNGVQAHGFGQIPYPEQQQTQYGQQLLHPNARAPQMQDMSHIPFLGQFRHVSYMDPSAQNYNYNNPNMGYQMHPPGMGVIPFQPNRPHFSQNALPIHNIPRKKPNKRDSNLTSKYQIENIFISIYPSYFGEEIKHLNLEKFKIEKCPINHNHNHKHCPYFHTYKDRRRKNDGMYSSEMCDHAETDRCEHGDKCDMAHNRVERLYHIEKYKTKFCTKFPKHLMNCEYGEYCSFAHSIRDIKSRIIHFMQKDSDFYMFYFKTEWCPFNKEHNKAQCDYAHNWQDFRRKPQLYYYDVFVACDNWKPETFIGKYEEGCAMQACCEKYHGWKEQEYHPYIYKTRPCQEDKCEGELDCPYYHSQLDIRVVTQQNYQEVSVPKKRSSVEDQIPISSNNLVVNNINHLRELLYNYQMMNLSLEQIQIKFQQNMIPMIILNYIEEKRVAMYSYGGQPMLGNIGGMMYVPIHVIPMQGSSMIGSHFTPQGSNYNMSCKETVNQQMSVQPTIAQKVRQIQIARGSQKNVITYDNLRFNHSPPLKSSVNVADNYYEDNQIQEVKSTSQSTLMANQSARMGPARDLLATQIDSEMESDYDDEEEEEEDHGGRKNRNKKHAYTKLDQMEPKGKGKVEEEEEEDEEEKYEEDI